MHLDRQRAGEQITGQVRAGQTPECRQPAKATLRLGVALGVAGRHR
jgi:hypothetical protein